MKQKHSILQVIQSKNANLVREHAQQLLQQKVAEALARERQTLAKGLLTEALPSYMGTASNLTGREFAREVARKFPPMPTIWKFYRTSVHINSTDLHALRALEVFARQKGLYTNSRESQRADRQLRITGFAPDKTIKEAKAPVYQCLECGKKLKAPRDTCPKCGGSDIDIISESAPPVNWDKGFSYPWTIGGGGKETPFMYNGRWYLHVFNQKTRKHAYYSYADDMFVNDYKTGDVVEHCDDERTDPTDGEHEIYEDTMPHGEVQRVYDETGDIAETEMLCGIRHLKVNSKGEVVSYVTESFITESDGQQVLDPTHTKNPFFDVIQKHGYVYTHSVPVIANGERITRHVYEKKGHRLSVFGNFWAASIGPNANSEFRGRSAATLHAYLSNTAQKFPELRESRK